MISHVRKPYWFVCYYDYQFNILRVLCDRKFSFHLRWMRINRFSSIWKHYCVVIYSHCCSTKRFRENSRILNATINEFRLWFSAINKRICHMWHAIEIFLSEKHKRRLTVLFRCDTVHVILLPQPTKVIVVFFCWKINDFKVLIKPKTCPQKPFWKPSKAICVDTQVQRNVKKFNCCPLLSDIKWPRSAFSLVEEQFNQTNKILMVRY